MSQIDKYSVDGPEENGIMAGFRDFCSSIYESAKGLLNERRTKIKELTPNYEQALNHLNWQDKGREVNVEYRGPRDVDFSDKTTLGDVLDFMEESEWDQTGWKDGECLSNDIKLTTTGTRIQE